MAAKWATVDVFYRRVPDVAAAVGVDWPTELERAVRQRLRAELGYELPSREVARD